MIRNGGKWSVFPWAPAKRMETENKRGSKIGFRLLSSPRLRFGAVRFFLIVHPLPAPHPVGACSCPESWKVTVKFSRAALNFFNLFPGARPEMPATRTENKGFFGRNRVYLVYFRATAAGLRSWPFSSAYR